jgi:hypothetical protein
LKLRIPKTLTSSQASRSIGFTGSRAGLTSSQRELLTNSLQELKHTYMYFHHGDCVGADEEANDIAKKIGYYIVIHPPTNPKQRAYCPISEFCTILPSKPYLKRNQEIVLASSILIAAPSSSKEQLRSGTWATVRFARKLKTPPHTTILKP